MVPRAELLATPGLRDLEVLRMPAGSNPSFLGRDAWENAARAVPAGGRLVRPGGVHDGPPGAPRRFGSA